MTRLKRCSCVAIALASLALAARPAGAVAGDVTNHLLAGSPNRLWLVVRSLETDRFDLLTGPAAMDEPWQWVHRSLGGTVTAAASIDGRLHVMLDNPVSYVVYDVDGRIIQGANPPGELWRPHSRLWAFCDARDFTDTTGPSLVALISDPAAAATQPDEAATEQPALPIDVMLMTDGAWRSLGTLPGMTADAMSSVHAVVAGGTLHAVRARGALHHVTWDAAQAVATERDGLDDRRVVGLISLNGQAVLVATNETGSGQAEIHTAALGGDGPLAFTPLTKNGKPMRWPSQAELVVTTAGATTAVVSVTDAAAELVVCDADGQATLTRPIAAFSAETLDEGGTTIQLVVEIGMMAATVLLMVTGARQGLRPMTMPLPVPIASLGRRAMAGLMDIVPFALLIYGGIYYWAVHISGAFTPDDFTPERTWDTLSRLGQTRVVAIVESAGMLLFLAYSVLTEARSGATLGKSAMQLAVVNLDGKRPSLRQVLIRNLLKTLVVFGPLMFLLLLPLITATRQRLGDMLARTLVADRRRSESDLAAHAANAYRHSQSDEDTNRPESDGEDPPPDQKT